ncbi:MAG: hypothetical protein JWP11_1916, partial [Frankiales bacterium]|nr:hypothetical protein [Frankiales bacterium]
MKCDPDSARVVVRADEEADRLGPGDVTVHAAVAQAMQSTPVLDLVPAALRSTLAVVPLPARDETFTAELPQASRPGEHRLTQLRRDIVLASSRGLRSVEGTS